MSNIHTIFNSFISEIIRGFPEYSDRINNYYKETLESDNDEDPKLIEFIDNLIPFEKEIYMNLLVAFLKEEERRMKAQQAAEARGG